MISMRGSMVKFLMAISLIALIACNEIVDSKDDIATETSIKDASITQVKAFDLPFSALRSEESKRAFEQQNEVMSRWIEEAGKCPSLFEIDLALVAEARECNRNNYYQSQFHKDLVARYATNIEQQTIAGVYTEVFVPKSGVAEENIDRVLINFHGGSFTHGSRSGGQMESIPIAAIGRIKVISVDYRMAPEYRFPAASDDVVAVYRELLKTYKPENIGLYGYSAGGVLTSQSIARFQQEGLPLPSAIAMIAGAASDWDGDLMHIGGAIMDYDLFAEPPVNYFEGADMSSPLVRPANSDEVLSKFPPSLLISATRDFALSNVIHTHRQLVRLGVDADLQIWEGMDHGLIASHYTPEGREAYGVIVDFFEKHLGQ